MPDWIREWWGVIGGVGAIVVGVVIAIFRFLARNEAKHEDSKVRIDAIEEQLEEGGSLFEQNRAEHKEIREDIHEVGESQARTETDIKWLVRRQKNGDKAGG